MDKNEAQLRLLNYNAGLETIYDRIRKTGNGLDRQLAKDSGGDLFSAFILGHIVGKSTISKEVLQWIKEGA